jgi:hypothetical protein
MEGAPSVLLGLLVLALLPGSVQSAAFLTPAERAALEAEFARDHAPSPFGLGLRGALALLRMVARNPYLWGAFVAGGLSSIASHTYLTYTPIIINALLSGKVRSGWGVGAVGGWVDDGGGARAGARRAMGRGRSAPAGARLALLPAPF